MGVECSLDDATLLGAHGRGEPLDPLLGDAGGIGDVIERLAGADARLDLADREPGFDPVVGLVGPVAGVDVGVTLVALASGVG